MRTRLSARDVCVELFGEDDADSHVAELEDAFAQLDEGDDELVLDALENDSIRYIRRGRVVVAEDHVAALERLLALDRSGNLRLVVAVALKRLARPVRPIEDVHLRRFRPELARPSAAASARPSKSVVGTWRSRPRARASSARRRICAARARRDDPDDESDSRLIEPALGGRVSMRGRR